MVEWKINSIKVRQEPHTNTVTELGYVASLGDSVRGGYVPLDPPGQPFIEYSDLTEQVCLEWVWGKVSKQATEEILTLQAAETTAESFPWISER